MSLYSKDLYRDIARNRQGWGVSYILMVSAIICSLITLGGLKTIYNFDISKYADNTTQQLFEDPDYTFEQNLNRVLSIASQIPQFSIIDGEISLPKTYENPYFIVDPLTQKNFAIFDTTGKYRSLDNEDAKILFTEKEIFVKDENGSHNALISEINQDSRLEDEDFQNFIEILSQIPLITITDGKASIGDLASPYAIKDKDSNPLAIIDLDNNITSLDDSTALVLLNKDKLLVKTPISKKIHETKLSELSADTIFTAFESTLKSLRTALTWALPLVVTPLFTIFSAMFTLASLVFYSMVAFCISKLFKLPTFDFKTNYRLCAFAMTPVLALNIIIPQVFENQGLIYFLIAVGYIYFALKSNANAT